jgi:HNH endonuclease
MWKKRRFYNDLPKRRPPRKGVIPYLARLYQAPKKGFDAEGLTRSRRAMDLPDEDYAGAVCLLLPYGDATLVDASWFDYLIESEWQVMGRGIFTPKRPERTARGKRVGMRQLHRALLERRGNLNTDLVSGWNAGRVLQKQLAEKDVDHKNRNPFDNRFENLRFATHRQNCQNKGPVPASSSRFKGVTKVKGKDRWVANACLAGKKYYLGRFDDEVRAAMAYNAFVKKHCPEFGYLNPIVALPTDREFTPERKRKAT